MWYNDDDLTILHSAKQLVYYHGADWIFLVDFSSNNRNIPMISDFGFWLDLSSEILLLRFKVDSWFICWTTVEFYGSTFGSETDRFFLL